MSKKISITIYPDLTQAQRLKLLSERTKVPVAVYIREGIDLILEHVVKAQSSLEEKQSLERFLLTKPGHTGLQP